MVDLSHGSKVYEINILVHLLLQRCDARRHGWQTHVNARHVTRPLPSHVLNTLRAQHCGTFRPRSQARSRLTAEAGLWIPWNHAIDHRDGPAPAAALKERPRGGRTMEG
jgi:hypothetical protein